MDNTFDLDQAKKAKVFVVLSPVGKYYPRGFVPVKLLCDTKYIRAWPNGFGDKKVGGNYAPTIKSGSDAVAANCDQVLWLLHDNVTEVGTMNIMVYWTNDKGEKELITPALDGTILPGVTRDSILSLLREKGDFKVSEREFSIHELANACKEQRVFEAFGVGTAAVVCPIKEFVYQGKNYHIPIEEEKGAGPLTQEVLGMMTDLQYGRVNRPDW
jgi:branched-chain amino acid aminotransferase